MSDELFHKNVKQRQDLEKKQGLNRNEREISREGSGGGQYWTELRQGENENPKLIIW